MAINDTTANTLSNWFTTAIGGQNTAATTPTAATTTTAAATPTATNSVLAKAGSTTPAATTATTATKATPSVSSWYDQVTGRKGEQAGIDYWQSALDSGANADDLYKQFVKSAVDNNDYNPNTTPAQLDLDSLKNRSVTSGQTVSGQLQGLLDANSDYIQSARDRTLRTANARGLTNSSIAASAGEDAAYQAAMPIATSDAQVNRDVDAYNAALYNQGLMYNTDAQNAAITKDRDYINQANVLAQQQSGQKDLATQQIAADKASQTAALGSQMSIAQLQAETTKYQSDKTAANSQYNTDANTKIQAEQNKTTLVNNIIQSAELSPDRKAELLKQLGETGLASAIYVAADIASDLQTPETTVPGSDGGG